MERRSESAVTAGRPRRSRARLKDRVAHAYYDYGRLCSSHPFSCLSFSIITFVLLSYPAIGRLRLPSSSPVDVHWSDTVEVAPGNDVPEWLQLTPSVYLQQIVVKGKVDPWNQSTLTQEMAVKGPLSRAFTIQKRLREFVTASNMRLDKQQCFHVHDKPAMPLLPDHGCLVLTPALFWENDEEKFFQDDDVIAKIFKPSCTPSMCPRELLLGMPTGMTGIKRKYSTNRQRDIDYSITIVLSQHRPEYISALKASLASLPEFEAIVSKGVDESTFVHVFYRPRKYFSDYFPLVTLYIVFLLYIYFSASKFEMVKSKWGLAFAAVLTVASTLTMTMGICAQLDITPTLWGAELFPYLAMIVGLENTLCITRAVVYTPPTLDVRSRLAHGLSHEGYSITKNFLTELVILAAGFFTFVPEIQEFCTFAVIGLVVDFYMQLFFYAPCLTFDLLRMGAEDKQRFSLMLFKSDPVELQVYPAIKCPMQRLWPRLFEGFEKSGQGLFRVKSESGLNEALVGESTTPIRPASHRRTASNSAVDVDVDMKRRGKLFNSANKKSNRLRILYYWTRTRIVQRVIMVVTVVWILWLAFIVHQWRLLGNSPKSVDSQSNETDSASDGFGVSHRRISTAPLEWSLWQKRTFRWWPVLLDEYNKSLSGHYITFLPPIVLSAIVPPDDSSIKYSGGARERTVAQEQTQLASGDDSGGVGLTVGGPGTELKYRISWLELQMTVILVISVSLFATVAAFILYVCFWRHGGDASRIAQEVMQSPKKTHRRVGSRAIVEAVPLVFAGHERDVECVCYDESGIIASSCIGGRLLVWNAATGDCFRQLPRAGPNVAPPPRSRMPGVSISEAPSSSPEHESLLRRRAVSNVSAASGQSGSSFLTSRSPNVSISEPVDFGARGDEQQRSATATAAPAAPVPPPPSQIWCMTMNKQNIILAGCANGTVEIWDVASGNALGLYNRSSIGVTYVQLKGNRLIVARLNGMLDFVELRFSQNANQMPTKVIQCTHLNTVTAHQLPINALRVAAISAVTASDDHTLKLFDLRTCRQTHTLNGHNAPVLIVCVDETDQVIYSSCAQGNIFCWDLIDGALLRTLDDAFYTNAPVQLACTDALLIGYSNDRKLWMWQKSNGQLITSIKREGDTNNNNCAPALTSSKSCLVALSDQTAVTSQGASVTFWDLRYKVMLRELHLDKPSCVDIDKLIAIDAQSVACCKANNVYRINMPIIRLKNS